MNKKGNNARVARSCRLPVASYQLPVPSCRLLRERKTTSAARHGAGAARAAIYFCSAKMRYTPAACDIFCCRKMRYIPLARNVAENTARFDFEYAAFGSTNIGSAAHRAPRRFSGGFRFDYVSIPPGASRRRPLREATTSLQKTTANGGRAVLRNRSAKVDLKRNAPKPIRFGSTFIQSKTRSVFLA